jgi:8-oxo-dGTP diphosphatase
MDELLARAWRAAGPLRGWLAWVLHATFAVGVTGVVRAEDGRVLLLRHRFWPEDSQWGFPGGFAKRGEQFSETVVREVREETGLTVTVDRLLEVRVGERYRAEVYYEATLVGGIEGLALQESEILEGRLFALDSLPAAMAPMHKQFAKRDAKSV